MSYGYIAYAWGMILTQAFNGAGDTMTPTWINIICFWMLEIPLALLFAYTLEMGPDGVFWSVAVSEAVLAGVAAFVFRHAPDCTGAPPSGLSDQGFLFAATLCSISSPATFVSMNRHTTAVEACER